MRQHITERTKFPDFKFAIAHRFDFGVVTGRNINLDLAADLVADHLSDLFINRRQPRRRVVRLDAKPDRPAVWTIVGYCGLRCTGDGKHHGGRHEGCSCSQMELAIHLKAPCLPH